MSKRSTYDCRKESDLPWVNSSLYEPESDNSLEIPDKLLPNLHPVVIPFQETEKIADSYASPDSLRKEFFSSPYHQHVSGNSLCFSSDFVKFQQSQSKFLKTAPLLSNDHPNKMYEMPSSTKNFYTGSIQKEKCFYDKCFIINLFIESKDSHLGPFPFEIHPKTNTRLLKLQVEKELGIPTAFQSWIINKMNLDYDIPLIDYGVTPLTPIFLYIDSSFKKPLNEKVIMERCEKRHTFKNGSYFAPSFDILSINKNDNYISKPADFPGSAKNVYRFPVIPQGGLVASSVVNMLSSTKTKKNYQESPDISSTRLVKKAPKVNKIRIEERKSSNSSEKEIKELNCFKNSSKIIKTCSDDSSCKSKKDELSCKEYLNSSKVENENVSLLGDAKMCKTEGVSCENDKSECSRVLIEPESHKQEFSIHRKDSKPSILKQIKEIHKTKMLKKVPGANAEESLYKGEEILSSELLVNEVDNIINHDSAVVAKEGSQFDYNLSDLIHAEGRGTVATCVVPCQLLGAAVIPDEPISDTEITISASDQKTAITYHEEFHDEEQKENLAEENASRLVPDPNEESPYNEDQKENLSEDIASKLIPDEDNISPPTIISTSEMTVTESSYRPEVIDVRQPSLEVFIECSEPGTASDLTVEKAKEHKEEVNSISKELAENYDFLLRMENLNLVKNVLHFTCPICFGEFKSDEGVVLHECLHTFCVECLAKAIDYAQEALVKCPYRDDDYSCQSYLQQREVKALVSPEVYERYLQRSIITAESLAEKSFHCKTLDCLGWCMFEDNINVFHCPVCLHYNCLNCQAIHEGLNCRQYQDKLKKEVKIDKDSEKTLVLLNKMIEDGKAMKCPKCDLIVMKKWGCDWLKCCICKTEICWITKGPRWGPGGQGDTSGGCKCGVNGKKCHPSCTYCH